MKLSTSIILGCAAQIAAEAPEELVKNDPSVKFIADHETGGALSSPTNNNEASTTTINNHKPRRLLQRMKKRREAHFTGFANNDNNKFENSGSDSDIGILGRAPRFLQENDYDYYCPRDTCPTELCDCADSGGSLEDCVDQLQAVCRAGKLDQCVFKDYVEVYQEVYCPFASCAASGHRENQCDCAFYTLYCDKLQNCKSDDPDKKPFFGCDEAELADMCEEAKACTDRGDLQGLDLGEWTGAGSIGLPNGGDKLGGGSVVFGVTFLSMLWAMIMNYA